MSFFDSLEFADLIAFQHTKAVELHGNLGISIGAMRLRLAAISNRHLGPSPSPSSLSQFMRQIHMQDLVLAMACAQRTEVGWQAFRTLYRKYICEICYYLIRNGTEAEEFADSIWGELFMPDRSGQSKIASFDGRSSLSTWLRVIVSNRIINDKRRKFYCLLTLDDISEPIDAAALQSVEGQLRSRRYEEMIMRCLKLAMKDLSEHDRTILLLRYDDGLRLGEVAKLCSVHQSTITRQLERVVSRLREKVIQLLSSDHGLDAAGIEECITIALESFTATIPILAFIRSISDAVTEPTELMESILLAKNGHKANVANSSCVA